MTHCNRISCMTVAAFAGSLLFATIGQAGENEELVSAPTPAPQGNVQVGPRTYGLVGYGYSFSSAKILRGNTWEAVLGLRTFGGGESHTANLELMISQVFADGDDLGRTAIGFGGRTIWTWDAITLHVPLHLIYSERTASAAGRTYGGLAIGVGVECYYQLFSIGENRFAIGLRGHGVATNTVNASKDLSVAVRGETGLGLYIF
jgi:hypothetical protein